jgi:hypothetical protein
MLHIKCLILIYACTATYIYGAAYDPQEETDYPEFMTSLGEFVDDPTPSPTRPILYPSSSDSEDQFENIFNDLPSSSSPKLRFSDCVTCIQVPMPGSAVFFAPLIRDRSYRTNLTNNAPLTDNYNVLASCVGVVSCSLDTQTANEVVDTFAYATLSDKCLPYTPYVKFRCYDDQARNPHVSPENISTLAMDQTIRQRLKNSSAKLAAKLKITQVSISLCWYNSTSENNSLKLYHQSIVYNQKPTTPEFARLSKEDAKLLRVMAASGIIVPAELIPIVRLMNSATESTSVAQASSTNVFTNIIQQAQRLCIGASDIEEPIVIRQPEPTAATYVAAIQRQAQQMCVGATTIHEVPIYMVNDNYPAYLAQEFSDHPLPRDDTRPPCAHQ